MKRHGLRRYGVRVSAIVLLAAACADQTQRSDSTVIAARAECAGGGGLLSGSQVGTLTLGISADSAKALCPAFLDTIEYSEGETTSILIAMIGPDSLAGVLSGGVLFAIRTTSAAFQTVDSLGAGIPIGRLLTLQRLSGGFGEGDFYLFNEGQEACGISFRVDEATARRIDPTMPVNAATFRPFAETGRVASVLVRGC